MTLAEMWVRFMGDASNLQKTIQDSRKSIETFGRDMENVGRRLAVSVSLPLAAAGLAAAKVAGEMEQNAVAFTTLLKSADAAKAHLEALQAFALKTPFQFPELARASRLMHAMGFAVREVIPMMTTLGNAVSAMGGGNEMLQRIILSFGQMRARGKLTGEELRELAHANIPALKLVADALGISSAEAMKRVEKGAISAQVAMDAILNYMNTRFKGGMEAQTKTLLGMWSNVRDKITFTLADVGKAMLPMAKDIITNYIDPLLGKIRELAGEFATLPPAIQKVTLGTGALIAVAPLAIWGLGSLATNAAALMKVLVPLATSIATVVYAVSTGLTGALVGVEVLLLGMAKYVAPILALSWALKKFNDEAERTGTRRPFEGGGAGAPIPVQSPGGWYGMMHPDVLPKQPGPNFADINRLQNIASATRGFEALNDALKTTVETAADLGKSWKDLGLKDLRTELKEAEAGYHALRSAGVMSLGDIAEAEKKLGELRREITDRTLGAGIMDLAARAWFKAAEGIKAVTDAVAAFITAGQPFGKKLELDTQALDAGATAAYQYANALKVAYDQMHTLPISGAANIQMLEPDWTKQYKGKTAARGTTLEAALSADSAVALRRAANLAGNEWERMIALQKTGARTAVDVKLAYEKWVEAEERAVGITNKHKQAMSGFRMAAVSMAREISTAFSDMARNISEIIWPRGGTSEPEWLATQQRAAQALKQAYEDLAGRGYNDPRRALEEIITRIKNAGSVAEANALAIKHFGSSGVEMARLIREGTLSTEQFAEALDVATGKIAQLKAETEKGAKGIASIFEEVARAVLRSIITVIIEQGLLKLIKVLGLVKSDVKTLEDAFGVLIGKIGTALASVIGLGKKATETVAEIAGVSAAGTIASTSAEAAKIAGAGIPGGIGLAGASTSAAGGAGQAAASSLSGIVGAVGSVVSAVSGVVGNFQMAGMNKSLDLIEHETRFAQIHLLNILEKLNAFLPGIKDIWDYNWNAQFPLLLKMTTALETGGGGTVFNITFNNVPTNDARAIVEAIKGYVSARSPVFAS